MTDLNADDSNGDGVPDYQELSDPTDMDADGTPDDEQDDIKCVSTEDGLRFIGISIKGSTTVAAIDSLISEDAGSLLANSTSYEKPESLPFGLINFKLLLTEPGATATVDIYFSEPTDSDSKWYKYDPIEVLWHDYSAFTEFGVGYTNVTVTIQDGGFGDADGVENGIIVDPAGVGVPSTSSDSGNDGDGLGDMLNDLNLGCFITTAALQPSDAETKKLWSEIRGRELAIVFISLFLIYAGKLAVFRIRQTWTHIRQT